MTDTRPKRYSDKTKRGCPTCRGIHAKSCMRCAGKTAMRNWYETATGWAHVSELTNSERAMLND